MIYDLIQGGFVAGRRAFLKTASVATTMTILGIRGAHRAYAQVSDYITARIRATYTHDEAMKYRKSQDNPAVKRLYSECLTHPMCPKSEKLLHAVYKDRSAGVKGLK